MFLFCIIQYFTCSLLFQIGYGEIESTDDDVDMANPFDDDSEIPDDDIEYDELDEEDNQ